MLDPRYTRRLTPDEDGGFTATIHEFPGCIAEGETASEAIEKLETTALEWIRAANANGFKISPPVDFEGASGKIALRISKRIHREAIERAELEGVSLNQLISVAIATYLGQQDGMVRCAEMVREHLGFGVSKFYNPMKWEHHVTAVTSPGHISLKSPWADKFISSQQDNLMFTVYG